MSKFISGSLPAILLGASASAEDVVSTPDPAGVDFFEKKIRPILSENCDSCHAADTKASGGLRVDDLNGLLTGGDAGPALIKG